MAQIPNCSDGQLELLRKILLQFISLAPGSPESLLPGCSDSITDLYRKILLTLPYI